MFDYIAYRLVVYFKTRDESVAMENTINFLTIFQVSLLVPLYFLINIFIKTDLHYFSKYVTFGFALIITIGLIKINNHLYKKKLSAEGLEKLNEKYHKEKYFISIWVILLSPVFFAFICPLIYGTINGSLHFPAFEK